MTKAPPRLLRPRASWSDERLVRACLQGSEEAWEAVLQKYKNLVYSIPMKYGFTPEDAADVFQSVWLDLVKELPKLREPKALSGWLIKVTANRCFQWRRREGRYPRSEMEEPVETPRLDELLDEVEREQSVREAVASLSERCRRLIQMLFFELPPLPYAEVAKKLGLARGSIGFIRGRCLNRLRRRLGERGFEG